MKNKNLKLAILFLSLMLLVFPQIGKAENNVTSNTIDNPDIYAYPYDFDFLVLDFEVNLDEADVLQDMVVEKSLILNYPYEVAKVIFWQDAGQAGWQGMGTDNKLGEAENYGDQFYLTDLNLELEAGQNRFFVSIETAERTLSTEKLFSFSLPSFNDVNGDGRFEISDGGLFFDSGLALPADNINSQLFRLRTSSQDYFAPKIVMTGATSFDTNTVTLSGQARDHGRSGLKSIEISIAPAGGAENWQAVPTAENWSYTTTLVNGDYLVKLRAIDNYSNTAIAEATEISVNYIPPQTEEQNLSESKNESTVETEEIAPEIIPAAVVIKRDIEKERAKLGLFVRITGHLPGTTHDWKILHDLAYGINDSRIIKRNLTWERWGIGGFGQIYGRLPSTTEDWNVVRVIAYSGIY